MAKNKRQMNSSIERYDQLHSYGREEAMSIEEANADGCNFYDNEATRKAFSDFKECFRNFCEEQNCIEGEPFAQEAPSIKTFLDLHKATKRPSRRLKIGVKAPPVVTIERRHFVEAPMPTPRAADIPKVSAIPKATVLPLMKKIQPSPSPALEKTIENLSLDEASFEAYVQKSDFQAFQDSVFFLPKNYEQEFLKNKAEFVKRHAFRGKEEVLDKLLRFRSLMRQQKWSEANEIEIVSMTGRTHKCANITFNFNSLDDCLADFNKIPFIQMLSIAPLKR
jgi:hypothetical protein